MKPTLRQILILPIVVIAFCIDVVTGDMMTGVKTSVRDKFKEHLAAWRAI